MVASVVHHLVTAWDFRYLPLLVHLQLSKALNGSYLGGGSCTNFLLRIIWWGFLKEAVGVVCGRHDGCTIERLDRFVYFIHSTWPALGVGGVVGYVVYSSKTQ